MIIVNDMECRNLQQQVAKNMNDIANITKDRTVKVYTYTEVNDVDPNVPVNFTGTITTINDVVISVVGLVNTQDNIKTYVVKFDDIDTADNTIFIYGYDDNTVQINIGDFDDVREYKLY